MKTVVVALIALVLGFALAVVVLRHRTHTVVTERLVESVPVVEMSGPLDSAGAKKIIRALRRAESIRPAYVVITFDSPGGEVAATLDVADVIRGLSVPSVCLVHEAAGGTVFMIAASKRVYFSPHGVCGAAIPVISHGGAPESDGVAQKLLSYTRSRIRSYAEANGHDAAVFEAMMDPSMQLVREGKTWKREGMILSLTATEALAIGLSSGSASSPEEVIAQEDKKKANQALQTTPMARSEI